MIVRSGMCIVLLTFGSFSISICQDRKSWIEELAKVSYIWMSQADTLGRMAHDYRARPIAEGGGGGSYVGFKIPAAYRSGQVADFSIHDVVRDEIVFYVGEHMTHWFYFYPIDSTGKRMKEDDTSPARGKNRNAMYPEVLAIAKNAQAYRKSTRLRSTYEGFSIPDSLATAEHATYSLEEVSKDKLIIRAVETNNLGTDFYKVDEKQNIHLCLLGEYRPKHK